MCPERQTARVQGFSDAVFAIAMTLLALELKRPMLSAGMNNKAFWASLLDSWPSILTFLISFGTLLTLWVNHHGIFELIYKVNRALLFVNGILMMFLVTVPFTTAVLTEHLSTSSAGAATALYAGMFAMVNVAYYVLWLVASSNRSLLKPGVSEYNIHRLRKVLLAGIPMYIVAIIASFFNHKVSLAILILLWTYWALQRRSIAIDAQKK